MHPNPAYRQMPDDINLGFARDRGFGTLAVNGADGPLLSHVPFVLSDDGRFADLHLVRSNPILRALTAPLPACIAVAGPDGYVSPDWYGVADQVPTWNYVAVHMRGTLEQLPDSALRRHLDALSAQNEALLLPKTPWTADKMTPDAMTRMMRMIVPCRLAIQSVDGTWKLNQNKPDAVRLSAAKEMAARGMGQDTGLLSALMMTPPKA